MYTNQMILNCGKAANLVQSANTSLYKMTVPTGVAFRVQKIVVRVSTACGNTTSASVKLLKGSTVLKTSTGVGISAAIGKTTCDTVSELSTATNHFKAADVLEIQVAVTATSTGLADIDLVIALDNV